MFPKNLDILQFQIRNRIFWFPVRIARILIEKVFYDPEQWFWKVVGGISDWMDVLYFSKFLSLEEAHSIVWLESNWSHSQGMYNIVSSWVLLMLFVHCFTGWVLSFTFTHLLGYDSGLCEICMVWDTCTESQRVTQRASVCDVGTSGDHWSNTHCSSQLYDTLQQHTH